MRVGKTLKLKRKQSVKVREGYFGFIDYQTGERGHSIDFLMRYLNYSFEEAVIALLNFERGDVDL